MSSAQPTPDQQTPRQMVFVDIETTGLDQQIHETIEVAWWVEGTHPSEIYDLILPHTLANADRAALDVNQYNHRELWDRSRWCLPEDIAGFQKIIQGKTLVGANVGGFDTRFLPRVTGTVWHHRVIEFESWVMGRLRLPQVLSLRDSIEAVSEYLGETIDPPNHTALGDVRAMQQCWLALNRGGWPTEVSEEVAVRERAAHYGVTETAMRDFLSRPPADRPAT